ncbi:MFS transporter [Micromonospora sp. WMMA1949]|uniref:MFS transporter n=1 Tax=Micromonospora sp. WMMA1949 TaxID=3015162 RepID=UPI0022B675C6|nr:MFS transporter [Micromonospora sp. WMMA1949]MCZ7428750.1 MFS transporter [Micromonospora sp. WMMA1949]
MSDLLRHRVGAVVPTLLLLNTAGSFFVLLRLSTEVSEVTGSTLLAALVLAAPWLPALILVRPLNRLLAGRAPARLILVAEVASLVLTLAVVATPLSGNPFFLVAAVALMVRGFGEAVTRSSATVLIKLTIPADRLGRVNTLAEIGKLGGTSIGAVLTGLADPALGVRTILALNAASLLLSAALAVTLPGAVPAPAAGGDGPPRLRLANPHLRRLFVLFVLVACLQGYHTIAVNAVPRDVLGGGTDLVAAFVTVSAFAVFAGSFVALPVQRHAHRLPSFIWTLVPLPFLLTAVLAGAEIPTLTAYAFFLLFFEVAFVQYNNLVVATATEQEVATVATLRATLLPLGVVVSTMGIGLTADLTSTVTATVLVVVLTVGVTLGTLMWRPPAQGSGRPAPAADPDQVPHQAHKGNRTAVTRQE